MNSIESSGMIGNRLSFMLNLQDLAGNMHTIVDRHLNPKSKTEVEGTDVSGKRV